MRNKILTGHLPWTGERRLLVRLFVRIPGRDSEVIVPPIPGFALQVRDSQRVGVMPQDLVEDGDSAVLVGGNTVTIR